MDRSAPIFKAPDKCVKIFISKFRGYVFYFCCRNIYFNDVEWLSFQKNYEELQEIKIEGE